MCYHHQQMTTTLTALLPPENLSVKVLQIIQQAVSVILRQTVVLVDLLVFQEQPSGECVPLLTSQCSHHLELHHVPMDLQTRKNETSNGLIAFSMEARGTIQVPPSNADVGKKHIPKEECRTAAFEAPATPGLPATTTVDVQLHSPQLLEDKDRCIGAATHNTNSFNLSGQSYGFGTDKDLIISPNGNIQSACSDMASLRIGS